MLKSGTCLGILSLGVFLLVGCALKPQPSNRIYLAQRSANWIQVGAYLDNNDTPALTKEANQKAFRDHVWKLTPKRIRWWVKSILGTLIGFCFIGVVFIIRKVK